MPVPYIENWHFTVNFPQHFETTADAQFPWGKFSVKCQFPIQGTGISHVISPKQTIIKFPTRNYTQLQGKLHVKCQFPIQGTGISQEISPIQTEHQLLLQNAGGKFPVKCQFSIQGTGISQEISPTQTEHQLLP